MVILVLAPLSNMMYSFVVWGVCKLWHIIPLNDGLTLSFGMCSFHGELSSVVLFSCCEVGVSFCGVLLIFGELELSSIRLILFGCG